MDSPLARLWPGIDLRHFGLVDYEVLSDKSIRTRIQDTYCTGDFRHIFFCALDTDRTQCAVAGGVSAYLKCSSDVLN